MNTKYILFINSLSACVCVSDVTVPRFNSPAEQARTVGFGKWDSAQTVGFEKRDLEKRDSENEIQKIHVIRAPSTFSMAEPILPVN